MNTTRRSQLLVWVGLQGPLEYLRADPRTVQAACECAEWQRAGRAAEAARATAQAVEEKQAETARAAAAAAARSAAEEAAKRPAGGNAPGKRPVRKG